ncbi:MAG: recombinase RecX [Flavobacteriaceae bacterium]|nr:recombinase RecX [Flavobacteriaceae bacterium]|tara:strand:- start:1103 stop:1576 length:474 start_codon:yes stop_codon:yes gene_type:complete
MSIKNIKNNEVQKKIEFYCTYQERSHKEVTEKLFKMGLKKNTIDEILSNLIQNNFINEARFASSYTSGKFRIKLWGKKRIKYGLKNHNVSDYNIESALNQIRDEDYEKTLNHLTKKILNSCGKENLNKKKLKLFAALKYRGWESELIYRQMKKIDKV